MLYKRWSLPGRDRIRFTDEICKPPRLGGACSEGAVFKRHGAER
jgi:hypothetical protein